MTQVIAEIGINHNGKLKDALDLVRSARECGANMVKFQKRDIELCYTGEELTAPCDSPWGSTVEDKVRGRELDWDDFEEISIVAARIGIGWSTSCFDLRSLSELEMKFGDRIAFHKVPSAMAKHEAFLKQVASYRRYTIVSTGLCENISEISQVLSYFESARCPFAVNATTALYPCPPDRCNLLRIPALRREFSGWDFFKAVGYSGHEVGVLPSVIAAFLGAEFIERHFTLDRSAYGADQAASLEPEGLRRLVRDVHGLEAIKGDGRFSLIGDEKNPVLNLRTDI